MSSAADRWFVPDDEYHRTITDYAVVRRTAVSVRQDTLMLSKPIRTIDVNATFLDEYRNTAFEMGYKFADNGKLVFADVNDEDPAHREKVYGEWAKEARIREEVDDKAGEMRELAKSCVDAWFSDDDFPPTDDEGASRDERERWALEDLKELVDRGAVEAPIISKVITAKSVEDKEEILHLMSGQNGILTKRPVLTLISMIDSQQNTEVYETEGWVIGYDFIKELLVIKPFTSKGGRHPLAGKWHGDVAQDGVSFSGTPQEFAKAYVELGKSVKADNKDDGFKMLVHTIAAKWIDSFETALVTAYGTDFHTDLLAMKEAKVTIKETMKEIKFPAVKKKAKECGLDMEPFLWMLNFLESGEPTMRDVAAEAKERGEEKLAQNAAKLYDNIHKQIKAFNENPSLDLDL